MTALFADAVYRTAAGSVRTPLARGSDALTVMAMIAKAPRLAKRAWASPPLPYAAIFEASLVARMAGELLHPRTTSTSGSKTRSRSRPE